MCAATQTAGQTQVIELTPPGRAAVAVLLVTGPGASDAVQACFTPAAGRPLADTPPRSVVVGRWGGADGEEVVVCRHSETRIEVHTHGGYAAVQAVVASLFDRGCHPVSWRDWLLDEEPDPIRRAARLALADAPTARTAAVLLDQYDGALAAAIRAGRDAMLAGGWPGAVNTIDALLSLCDVGRHLTAPWQIVLVGRPNVGKSSLLNALVGHQRSIVCPLPGTTRDVVTMTTALDGWPVQLADTAGRRPAEDDVDTAAAALTDAAMAAADLVVVVHDATDPQKSASLSPFVPPPSAGTLHVVNKIDLIACHGKNLCADADVDEAVFTSALTGEGVAALAAAIAQRLVPIAPAPGDAVPFTDGQIASLKMARAAVARQDKAAVLAALGTWLAE